MKIKAPAKLNLSLNIFPQKRVDGLYRVKFLNCQLELADEIEFKPSEGVEVVCAHPELKEEKDNLVYQAVYLLPNKRGVKIFLRKRIPIRSGLGGGSSDAAAVINYLNRVWRLKLSPEELLEIGKNLGMDVVYCLIGGLCLVRGAGEKVRKLDFPLPKIPLIIVIPEVAKPSTKWAYQNLDLKKIGQKREKLGRLLEAIKKRDIKEIGKNLHNDFEYSINKKFPIIEKIKNDLKNQGALQAMLCGSGLSVMGIFENKMVAREAYNKLKKKFEKVFLTETI